MLDEDERVCVGQHFGFKNVAPQFLDQQYELLVCMPHHEQGLGL
jgi:hypothetical protein